MTTEKSRSKGKRISFLFFLCLIVAAAYFVCRFYKEDKEQEDKFLELAEVEDRRDDDFSPQETPEEDTNPDWIGWLNIPNTTISYPVMQKRGDNEFYLHRDFDGNESYYGTPFLDARCTKESSNCIIYGHNINKGRMFGALHAYADSSYQKEHPEIELRIKDDKRVYRIVSVMATDISSPVYDFVDTGNWNEYKAQVSKILSGSLYQTDYGVEIREEMNEKTEQEFYERYQFITLSTCRSWVGKRARLLVIAAREQKE